MVQPNKKLTLKNVKTVLQLMKTIQSKMKKQTWKWKQGRRTKELQQGTLFL